MTFGAGVTVLLLGVRMLIAEIVPAFMGFSEKLVPGAIPALDCPTLFPYGPNANVLGFLCSLAGSIVAILLLNGTGLFASVVVPLAFTCFFEAGTAAIVANAYGGVRGCAIASFVNGILMVLLVGFGSHFFMNTINNWMLVFGGNDFSLWGIIAGALARLIA
jgi:PTS system ascorbate-specific IIC component